jgi:hypothetical protein
LLVLLSVLFVNCGDNIKVYFSIVISFNFCVGTRVWRVWNLQSKNYFEVDFSSAAIFYWPFLSVIDRNRNWPFNLIQNKVGYRSCFATGVKLEQFLWNIYVFMYIKHHTLIWRWYLLVVILKIDIKYTFLVRFHIFSRNDRLFID